MIRFSKQWEKFEADVVPNDAGPNQREQLRDAFYGGAHVMNAIIQVIVKMKKAEGQAQIDAISAEFEDFAEEIKRKAEAAIERN